MALWTTFLKRKVCTHRQRIFFSGPNRKDTIDSEFEDDSQEQIDTVDSACGLENTRDNDISPANQYTVCVNCSCTYLEGHICLICQQDSDFEKFLEAGREIQLDTLLSESQLPATFAEDPVPLSLAEMRQQRVAIFSRQEENIDMHSYVDLTYSESECGAAVSDSTIEQSANRSEARQNCISNPPAASPLAINPTAANPPVANPPAANPLLPTPLSPTPLSQIPRLPNPPCCQPLRIQPPRDNPPPAAPLRELYVHRSHIRKDLISDFKDPSIMECALVFNMINERGETEKGEGIGVLREVFTLFGGNLPFP